MQRLQQRVFVARCTVSAIESSGALAIVSWNPYLGDMYASELLDPM